MSPTRKDFRVIALAASMASALLGCAAEPTATPPAAPGGMQKGAMEKDTRGGPMEKDAMGGPMEKGNMGGAMEKGSMGGTEK